MRLMEKITKRPPPLISFFASLEVQLAVIIIDYCAVICIIDPRQKVKRFISEIAYFKNLLCILKCLKFLWGKKRPPEGMCPQTCWCNHIDITSTSLIKTIGPIRSSFNSYSVISLFTLVSMIRGNRIGGTEKQRKCVARSRFLVISWRMSHCSDNRKCKENSLKLDTNKTFCKFTIVRGFFFFGNDRASRFLHLSWPVTEELLAFNASRPNFFWHFLICTDHDGTCDITRILTF